MALCVLSCGIALVLSFDGSRGCGEDTTGWGTRHPCPGSYRWDVTSDDLAPPTDPIGAIVSQCMRFAADIRLLTHHLRETGLG